MKTNIQNLYALFRATLIVLLLSFISQETSAHFGPRGPFGGTTTCSIVHNNIVYIGTENGGVFESTTSDITAWRARPVGLKSGKITSLTHSGSYLFAGTADSGIFIFDGFVGSDRYWNKINNGLSNLKIKSLLAIDSITILAGTDGNGLFKTTDKGANWTAVNFPAFSNTTIIGMQNLDEMIFLLTANKGVFMSDDAGKSWGDFNDVNTSNINASIISYNAITDELLVKNDNGLYRASAASMSAGATYTLVQPNIPGQYEIKSISHRNSEWFIATDLGIYTSNGNLSNWQAINTGLTSLDATTIAISDSNLVINIRENGMYKARLGTYNWTETNSNFNNIAVKTMVTSGDSLVIAVTSKGIHVSKNLSPNYVLSNTGLTDFSNINDIIIGNGKLYAATKNGGVFLSSDLGNNWTTINTGLSNLNISKLFYENGNLYLFDNAGNVFETSTTTIDWKTIQNGLPTNVSPSSIVYYDGNLILGTNGDGIFIKAQNETSWTAQNIGLSNLNVTSVTASANKLYAGTNGAGVFISDIDTIVWETTSPTSISHTSLMNLDGNKIQAMANYKGFVYASYKGGLVATSDSGKTWIAGGNQFNLPSYTDVNKISFVSSRVYVVTENNGLYSNSLSELPVIPDFLTVSKSSYVSHSDADSIIDISVSSNRDWEITTDQNWIATNITSGTNDGNFTIILPFGYYGGHRSGTVKITAGTEIKTITIEQFGTVGIEKTNNINSSLNIYPNPSDGNVSIDFKDAEINIQKVLLYDMAGKLLEERSFGNHKTTEHLNLKYPSGMYMLNVLTNKGIASQKLIIK